MFKRSPQHKHKTSSIRKPMQVVPAIRLQALEPRVLLDAAAVQTAVELSEQAHPAPAPQDTSSQDLMHALETVAPQAAAVETVDSASPVATLSAPVSTINPAITAVPANDAPVLTDTTRTLPTINEDNGVDSLDGIPRLTVEGAVLRAVNGARSLSGTQVLGASGAVLQAVNGVDSLNGIEQAGAPRDSALTQRPGFGPLEAHTVGSLRLEGGSLEISLFSRGSRSWIDLSASDGKSDIRFVKASLADGKALPSWIRVDGRGHIAIDRPAGADLLRLRIQVQRGNGEARSYLIEIDSNAGEMRHLAEPKDQKHQRERADKPAQHKTAAQNFAYQLAQASRRESAADDELMELLR